MKVLEIHTSPAYSVRVAPNLLKECGSHIKQIHAPCTAVLVTDSYVDTLYSKCVVQSLEANGFQIIKFVFPQGERSKNMEQYTALLTFMAEHDVTRSDLIVALGGGVVGDLAGFAAATYQRGINFVQLPTTLLAQIDSSVGGKTAVDLPQGKNLVGAFWQPELVLCDTTCLDTLSDEVRSDGLAEAIKYGMIADAQLLDDLCNDGLRRDPESVIARCIQIKADAVEADEHDNGQRQILNFGHTAGHAMERHSNYALTHGRAVAMGMATVTRACVRRGLTAPETQQRLEQALETNGLPNTSTLPADVLAQLAAADKKRRGGYITLVLPERVGKCVLSRVPMSELEDYFRG